MVNLPEKCISTPFVQLATTTINGYYNFTVVMLPTDIESNGVLVKVEGSLTL